MAVLYTQHFAQFFDDDGNPLALGKLYTYEADSTTPKATYTDQSAGTQNANPIILDAAGRASIWIDGAYKFVLKDSNDVTIKEANDITAFSVGSQSSLDLSAGTLLLPQSTSAAPVAEGSIAWDTDDNLLKVGDGASTAVMVGTTATQTLTNKTLGSGTVFPAGTIIGRAYSEYTANSNLGTIPGDDTIPQSGEGTQIISQAYTASTTTNRIRITVSGFGANSAAANFNTLALFVGASADAARATMTVQQGANETLNFTMAYEYVAGTVSSVTYALRGGASAGTFRMNGTSAARYLGGVGAVTMVIEEIVAS